MRSPKEKYHGKNRPLGKRKLRRWRIELEEQNKSQKIFRKSETDIKSRTSEETSEPLKCLVMEKHIKEGRCTLGTTIRNAYD